MDLSYIDETISEAFDNVSFANDRYYFKQLNVLEYFKNSDSDLKFDEVFTEGFHFPFLKRELNVYKFNNKHIIKSIDYFNDGYEKVFNEFKENPQIIEELNKQKKTQELGDLSINRSNGFIGDQDLKIGKRFIETLKTEFKKDNGKFKKGLNEFAKQFDCDLRIFTDDKVGTATLISSAGVENYNYGKLTISKSKGFQLGGLTIRMNINIAQIIELAPSKKEIFGQFLVSIMLHETYHAISHMSTVANTKLNKSLQSTLDAVAGSKNYITATTKLSSFMDEFKKIFNIKEKINTTRAKNRLFVLAKVKNNQSAVDQLQKDIEANKDRTLNDKEIDSYINELNSIVSKIQRQKTRKVLAVGVSILLTALGVGVGSTVAVVGGAVGFAVLSLQILKNELIHFLQKLIIGQKEEYYADLFASMYSLPVHLQSYYREIQFNKKSPDKTKQLRDIDQKISNMLRDVHPITFDREVVSYKVAKDILNSGRKLKPEIREYLEYIVMLHDGIDEIENKHDKKQAKKLSPEAAKDLQQTLNDFIKTTGATVTESFIETGGEIING